MQMGELTACFFIGDNSISGKKCRKDGYFNSINCQLRKYLSFIKLIRLYIT